MIKKVFAWIALCFLFATPAAAAGSICLNLADVASSKPNRDGTAIVFVMRDGKVWRNDLSKRCPDLGLNGFSWVVPGGQICENAQMIRVLNSGELCRLGSFTRIRSGR